MIEEMWDHHLQGNTIVSVCAWYFVLIAFKFLLYITYDVHPIWFSYSMQGAADMANCCKWYYNDNFTYDEYRSNECLIPKKFFFFALPCVSVNVPSFQPANSRNLASGFPGHALSNVIYVSRSMRVVASSIINCFGGLMYW